MATVAKDRREGRTKVLAFRVPRELQEEIEKVKAKAGLSITDLVKLGAGIAQEEVKHKLAELSGLRAKLIGVMDAIHREEERLNDFVSQERRRRLEDLDVEIAAYKLFDQGWRVEVVGHELKVPLARVRHYFEEWVEERGDKETAERELLKSCLREHIDRREEVWMWDGALRRVSKEELAESRKDIENLWRLLGAPEQMHREDKEFLITKYSSTILPAPRRKKS